jgi:hypothetical protein
LERAAEQKEIWRPKGNYYAEFYSVMCFHDVYCRERAA